MIIKEIYKLIFPVSCGKYLNKELRDCNSVLDLGCGNHSPLQLVKREHYKVGVELYAPYIKESKAKGIHDKYIKEDVMKLNLKPNSFDVVIALDLIEHLKKKEGIKLLKKMERWARKKIIIYTPNGFIMQDEKDRNKLQRHLSGWNVEDFKSRRYKIIGINGLRILREGQANIRFKPKFFWRIVSDISQKITYYYPNIAFQIFAVGVKYETENN